MRIVGGQWRGRMLKAPDDDRVRPTADRVREAWMSIVQLHIPGSRVLDLFAGTGALGLEALSRGAGAVDFVESSASSLRLLRENVAGLRVEDDVTIHRADAVRFAEALAADTYDLAFADPPYAGEDAARLAEVWAAVPFSGVLGIEHQSNVTLPHGGTRRRYGTTSITFFGL
jgi:16S rRNA (guanine966-N2)-methyltransferase